MEFLSILFLLALLVDKVKFVNFVHYAVLFNKEEDEFLSVFYRSFQSDYLEQKGMVSGYFSKFFR